MEDESLVVTSVNVRKCYMELTETYSAKQYKQKIAEAIGCKITDIHFEIKDKRAVKPSVEP